MSRSFNTFALKLKVHCKDCGMDLKKQLLKLKGVCSVEIDQKLGKVVISGKVDPAKILRKLEKRGREAELWPCEQLKVNDPLNDSDIVAQLEQLSDIPGLHTVEVTKTTKLTFQGQSTSNNPGITQSKLLTHGGGGGRLCSASSSCCGYHHGNTSFGSCYANNMNNCSHRNVLSTQTEVLSHGGGLCSASSSCCGGHNGNYTCSRSCCANNRSNYFCHSTWPPPMENRYIPSAPPLPSDYFQLPPSPPAFSCASFLLQFLK